MIYNINSIKPSIWGKSGWIFLFSIALTYNTKNREAYEKFFISIQDVLPCYSCNVNYKQHLNELSEDVFDSKENLLNWLLKIRNDIAIKKHQKIMSMDDVINEIYNNNNNNTCMNINNKLIWLVYFTIIILLLLLLYYINKN